jgi:hypothetical protein
MIDPRFFPASMMLLSFGAAVVYAMSEDYRRAIYWTAAAVITASVTF